MALAVHVDIVERTGLSFGEINNNVELVLLHERKEASPEDLGISDVRLL